MKKGFVLFVLMIGLAGSVSAQTKVLKPTLQKSRSIPSAITLVYPNGGETIIQGSRQTIQWKIAGTSPVLRIKLLRNGKTVHTIAKNYSAAKGRLVWNVGNVQPGGGYTIRIIAASGGLRATSKRPFSIVASTARALGATQPRKLTPKPHASGVSKNSSAKSKTADARSLSPAKGKQSPAQGVPEPEQKVAKPRGKEYQRYGEKSPPSATRPFFAPEQKVEKPKFKEYQRYGGENPPPAMRPFFAPEQKVEKPKFKEYQRYGGKSPPSATRPFFGPEDSPPARKSPVVTDDGEQSSPCQRQPEAKLPEQGGSWFDAPIDSTARQENLPTTSMETELATFPDFEVRGITFDPETRRLSIQIANRGTKDHLDSSLELRWQLDNLGPHVSSKDHLTLRKGEEKPWGITLDRSWNWPQDRGRLRCDVTADPNDNILEAKEDNNRHALWFYKTSGPDVNLAADHILVGLREQAFSSGQVLVLEPEDVSEFPDQDHVFDVDVKIPLVNYGDQADSGDLRIIAPEYYSGTVISRKRVSLQKGETRWIVMRKLMGTTQGKVPFKVTWKDDDHVLFEGELDLSPIFEQLGGLPDLYPSGFGFQPTNPDGTPHRVHQPFSFNVAVRNIGGATDETFRLLVEVTSPDEEVAYRVLHVVEGLGHLESEGNLRYGFIPEKAGYYTIRLKADSDRDVLEYNEDNNEFSSSGFRIQGESTSSDDRVP